MFTVFAFVVGVVVGIYKDTIVAKVKEALDSSK